MADQDRYSSHDRDRLGQRDVYMDNRTGVGAQSKGYRAEWGRGRDDDHGRDRYGDREQNYNQRRGENASFSDRDYGQSSGGGTGGAGGYYGESGTYGQGGRWSRNQNYDETYGGGRSSQSGSRYSAGDQQSNRQGGGRDHDHDRSWMSYPARSNPDFYADENRAAGPGWAEDFGEDRSLQSYRGQGQGQGQGRWSGGEGGYGSGYAGGGALRGRAYEADYNRDRDHRGGGEERGFWDRAADKVASWFGGDDSQGGQYGTRQSHRGRGPKNYRRSDDRVREDVSDRLSDDHWLDASEIEIVVATGEVTLTGTVNSRDDKRRAEQLAEQVSGVDNVQNNLRVTQQGQQQNQGWSNQSGQSMGGAMGSSGSNTTTGSGMGGGQSSGGSMSGGSASGSTTGEASTTSGLGDLGTANAGSGRSGKTTQ
ncbi:MAG: hypothetical protein JWO33_1521 [Caulobacteraceae bacterium]|nr:hypothetical protein [Caulobacteraceae bacterium]